jgi:Protein of unknown function (DUF3467)
MADDPNAAAPKPQLPALMRSKDFRTAFANTFRFRASPADIGLTFGYATQLPSPTGERSIVQDEVEVVITPSTLKVLKIAIDDHLEALEKIIGTIQLPQEVVDALAEQKKTMNDVAEAEKNKVPPSK